MISGAAAPKTMKKTNPRKPTSPQGDTLLESERADGRYVLDPSKPLTERQQLKLLGVTDITGQDQGPKCKDDNDRILLNVRLMSGSDESGAVRFRLSAKSKLKKLMRSYSEYMGLEEHKVVSAPGCPSLMTQQQSPAHASRSWTSCRSTDDWISRTTTPCMQSQC